MRFSVLYDFSLLSAILPGPVLSSPVDSSLNKRFDNARLTFFSVPVGTATACGTVISNSDFVVALNSAQFSTDDCFKEIAITANGKTVNAQIADECPSCPENGLDLTEGLFQQFAPLSAGLLIGSWDFV